MLEQFSKLLESMNGAVMSKVDDLEKTVMDRSEEIRENFFKSHLDMIEASKKLKEAMYESELKDLDIQRKTLAILDETEDKSIERAIKMQKVFGDSASDQTAWKAAATILKPAIPV